MPPRFVYVNPQGATPPTAPGVAPAASAVSASLPPYALSRPTSVSPPSVLVGAPPQPLYRGCGPDFGRRGSAGDHCTTVNCGPRPYRCPLDGCRSIFSRRYNMVQHFRSHAQRLGACADAIEAGAKALRNSPSYVTPSVATTAELMAVTAQLSQTDMASAAAALLSVSVPRPST
ncbi:hypothetical protein HK405_002183 [Cladochytrium tenue]|nr:hypothetical protein HK405_002183 [Cladochytrium tenue]